MDCSKLVNSIGVADRGFWVRQGRGSNYTDNTGTDSKASTNYFGASYPKALPGTDTEAYCSETYR